ncbi:MAG: hypothetical protein ORN21_05495, partial [Methylophilaceae bacterium]|nr:hypothetical protein [Methylophilaceae bacterium]
GPGTSVVYTILNSATTPGLSLASDTGSNASDGLTNNATINVSGLGSGASWTFSVDGGTWVSGTGSSFLATTGAHSYRVRQVDLAGNTSEISGQPIYTLDIVAPTTVPSLSLATDTGLSATDGITNVGLVRVNLANQEVGATWAYQVDGSGAWLTGNSGSTFLASTGLHTYTVRQVDLAGNAGSASTGVAYTFDNVAPTATLTSTTITASGSVVVRSNEASGNVYLVKNSVSVSSLSSIPGADAGLWKMVSVAQANVDINLSAAGLLPGTYNAFAMDTAGNLSVSSSNTITITLPSVSLSAIANGTGGYVINSSTTNMRLGEYVTSAGDINGDGMGDFIIGSG